MTNVSSYSTKRLKETLAATRRMECECDPYHGFTCNKHVRIQDIQYELLVRETLPPYCEPK